MNVAVRLTKESIQYINELNFEQHKAINAVELTSVPFLLWLSNCELAFQQWKDFLAGCVGELQWEGCNFDEVDEISKRKLDEFRHFERELKAHTSL